MRAKEDEMRATNVCEHGDHAAPDGKRFCGGECEECEHTAFDDEAHDCAGVCLRERVHKWLHVRVHECPHCGLIEDRDVNAAINVQRRGQRLRGGLNVQLEDPRSPYLAVFGR